MPESLSYENVTSVQQTKTDQRKSNKKKNLPAHLADYELNVDHLALSVESFIDEVPQSLEEAKTRPDYLH